MRVRHGRGTTRFRKEIWMMTQMRSRLGDGRRGRGKDLYRSRWEGRWGEGEGGEGGRETYVYEI